MSQLCPPQAPFFQKPISEQAVQSLLLPFWEPLILFVAMLAVSLARLLLMVRAVVFPSSSSGDGELSSRDSAPSFWSLSSPQAERWLSCPPASALFLFRGWQPCYKYCCHLGIDAASQALLPLLFSCISTFQKTRWGALPKDPCAGRGLPWLKGPGLWHLAAHQELHEVPQESGGHGCGSVVSTFALRVGGICSPVYRWQTHIACSQTALDK